MSETDFHSHMLLGMTNMLGIALAALADAGLLREDRAEVAASEARKLAEIVDERFEVDAIPAVPLALALRDLAALLRASRQGG